MDGIVTVLWAGQQRNCGCIPGRAERFIHLFCKVGPVPVACSMATGDNVARI